MLAYAATRRRAAERRSSPSTMLFIIGAHVAAVALAMSAKFAIERARETPTTVINIPLPDEPPPPVPPQPKTDTSLPKSSPYVPPTVIPMPSPPAADLLTTTRPSEPAGPVVGTAVPAPSTLPLPPPKIIEPLRIGPRLATPPSALRPPYPASKLDSAEEASLRLRLSIDERGRVVAVDPIGRADAAFLNAARKHLIARWRYQPATVDGQAIVSSTVITLRFELEG